MSADKANLAAIRTFPQLVKYLRDELDWPISSENFDDLLFDYSPEELGIDSKNAAKIQEIKRLRPLSVNQPWGVFFVKFEPKRLPVVALKRILNSVVLKKRASANHSERAAWDAEDLLFISNYGDGDARQITFAHFSQDLANDDLPTLKVLGWDNLDTPLHIDHVAEELSEHLAWPKDEADVDGWREAWQSAFTLRHRQVITTSKELAVRLAELARAIRDRIRTALAIETETGPLTKLLKAFREALVHDLDADGFADMYAQTIAYGLLSARIADPKSASDDDLAAHMLVTNPFLKELMETFMHVGGHRGKKSGPSLDFDELGVDEVVGLLDAANMEAIILDFGDRNPQEDPVIHFYELFLAEYDKKQKVSRGVFYTPRPVVSYIVRSVDELVRTEFGLEDGLASTTTWGEMAGRLGQVIPDDASPGQDFVQILDPATGTGTFLVEVIDLIHRTLVAKWKGQNQSESQIEALWNAYVPEHLLPRLHGYELLMAPYAIAHLKVGLKLHETGYRFDSSERARIYLTNALEPAQDLTGQLAVAIPALAHEAGAVSEIKRRQRFTVVIGNPPYANLSSNLSKDARSMVARYRQVDGQPIHERNALQLERNVNDDYIKFLALAEDVLEPCDTAIIGFITNNSYLDAQTLRGLRARLLSAFSSVNILDLGGSGDLSGTSLTVASDDNVFDIQQGVAVAILSRRMKPHERAATSYYRRITGTRSEKYAVLSGAAPSELSWEPVRPAAELYLLVPVADAPGWNGFVPLEGCFPVYAEGFKTGFDEALIAFTPEEADEKLSLLADFREGSPQDHFAVDMDKPGWAARLLADERKTAAMAKAARGSVERVAYRPLDFRYTALSSKLIKAPSRVAGRHMEGGRNICLVAARQVSGPPDVTHFLVSRSVPESRIFYTRKGTGSYFPLLSSGSVSQLLGSPESLVRADVRARLATALGVGWDDQDGGSGVGPMAFLSYCYAIFHAPSYRSKYRANLKTEFPRVPTSVSLDLFTKLADRGHELVSLHLMESLDQYTLITTYVGPKNPEVARVGWSDDTVWLDASATKRGQPTTPGTRGFKGMPEEVWNFHIGGYQVCEKWLKDRKGRTLSKDDIEHYQKIVVVLSETIRIMGEIDEVIEEHGGWPDAFAS